MLALPLLLSAGLALGSPVPALPRNALPVPIVLQNTDYSCGAGAALALLYYFGGWYGHEADLYGVLETTPKDGTHPEKLAEGLKVFGLTTELKVGMTIEEVRRSLAEGSPVILDLQAWPSEETRRKKTPWRDIWDDGHYVVAVGIDPDFIYVMDPSTPTSYAWVPLPELEDRWHDYEDRYGPIQRYEHLGIKVKGPKPLASYPAPLIHME